MILESPPIKKFYLPFEWISVNGKTQDELAKWGFVPSFLGSDERDTFIYQYMRAEEKDFISYLSSFEHIIAPSPYFLLIRDEIFRLLKETPKNMESFLSRLVLSIISITKNPHTLPSCYVISLLFCVVHRIAIFFHPSFPFCFPNKSHFAPMIKTFYYANSPRSVSTQSISSWLCTLFVITI